MEKKTTHAAEREREDVKAAREAWPAIIGAFPVQKLLFIDESCASTDMARSHGWGPVGQRVIGYVPQGHYKVQTILAGIRLSGPVAPLVFDGAVNGEIYRKWVEQFLIPELRPGDVVVADNLSSHKDAKAVELIVAAGCQMLFLPPYSPDMNPIENMWSKMKGTLRDIGARTIPALFKAVRKAWFGITPADCAGFFRHAGYGGVLTADYQPPS
jgi:transposase